MTTSPKMTSPTSDTPKMTSPTSDTPKMIDLRSDTITLPTPSMIEAMTKASLGDAVYGEDLETIKLETLAAETLGKEASLLTSSATMSNLICAMVHCTRRGVHAIIGHLSHMNVFEQGGISSVGGIFIKAVKNLENGCLDMNELKKAIDDGKDVHKTKTQLICLENTHNNCGGKAIPLEHIYELKKLADENDIKLHLDGSRVFNAAEYLQTSVSTLVAPFDSITICLSKGLACPIGSLIVGSHQFIKEATKIRKLIGGGMRQTGIIAGPAIIGFTEMSKRLNEDHEIAHKLALGISKLSKFGIHCNPNDVQTNIFFFDLTIINARDLQAKLKQPRDGLPVVKMNTYGNSLRCVTNYHITNKDVDLVVEKITLDAQDLYNQQTPINGHSQ